MDATQCRMARTGLGWRAQDLAARAGVGYATVARFEAGAAIANETRDKLRAALEAGGAQFSRRSERVGVTIGSRIPSLKEIAAQIEQMPVGPKKQAQRQEISGLKVARRSVARVKKAIRDTQKDD